MPPREAKLSQYCRKLSQDGDKLGRDDAKWSQDWVKEAKLKPRWHQVGPRWEPIFGQGGQVEDKMAISWAEMARSGAKMGLRGRQVEKMFKNE